MTNFRLGVDHLTFEFGGGGGEGNHTCTKKIHVPDHWPPKIHTFSEAKKARYTEKQKSISCI